TGPVGPIQVSANRKDPRPVVNGVNPARASQRRAVANVPEPVILQKGKVFAKVVAVRTRKVRAGQVERHPVHFVLLARITTLGLEALADVQLENLNVVERVDVRLEESPDGVSLRVEDAIRLAQSR